MIEFVRDLQRHDFLQCALLAGLLASVACGIVGSYVVVRRITYIAGGIAHFVLGGMGVAKYLSVTYGWSWLHPLHGAVVSSMMAAAGIGIVSLRAREREDTVISALWAVGMAVGILFISQTPGYNEDLMSYLFGNILLVDRQDLWLIGALDVVVVLMVLLFYNRFLAICLDEEFARLRGVRVELYYMLLLCLAALTVVVLVTVVGIVMVIALLTLPVAVVGHFSRRLWHMMVLATSLSFLLTSAGLAISYRPDLPAGATTIVLAGLAYLLVCAGGLLHRRWWRSSSARLEAPSASPGAPSDR